MPSIFDVARRAQVAIGTVSRVINGDRHVATETRKRVLAAVRALDYRPNPAARSLRTKRTHLIALTLPELANPFYASIVEGVQKELEAADYHLILCGPPTSPAPEPRYLELLAARHVDGLIVSSRRLSCDDKVSRELARLGQEGHPIVWLGGPPKASPLAFDCVYCDTTQGIRQAMLHLLSLGHRRVAYFGPPKGVVENRLQTCREVLAAHKVNASVSQVFRDEPTLESGFKMAELLLKAASRPTAVLAVNDVVAIGAMMAFQEHGIAVPDEISVIGIDDLPLASLVRPTLTTVSQPKDELGKLGARRLLDRLGGRIQKFEILTLPTQLIVRSSTSSPKCVPT